MLHKQPPDHKCFQSWRSGRKQCEPIREAVDEFFCKRNQVSRRQVLNNAAGIRQDRGDLPDLNAFRRFTAGALSSNCDVKNQHLLSRNLSSLGSA
jgi:hypothetical protein